jgi:hypothetical protein
MREYETIGTINGEQVACYMQVDGTRTSRFTEHGQNLDAWADECAEDRSTSTYRDICGIIDRLNDMEESHREQHERGGVSHGRGSHIPNFTARTTFADGAIDYD